MILQQIASPDPPGAIRQILPVRSESEYGHPGDDQGANEPQ